MTTKTCTNGHVMTGIGFDECPECEAPWIATPIVEELARKFCNSFASKLVPSNEAMIATRLLHGLVPELLTTYGNARYDEGVKAGREEDVSYIGYKQGWEESEDVYREHFGLATKYK